MTDSIGQIQKLSRSATCLHLLFSIVCIYITYVQSLATPLPGPLRALLLSHWSQSWKPLPATTAGPLPCLWYGDGNFSLNKDTPGQAYETLLGCISFLFPSTEIFTHQRESPYLMGVWCSLKQHTGSNKERCLAAWGGQQALSSNPHWGWQGAFITSCCPERGTQEGPCWPGGSAAMHRPGDLMCPLNIPLDLDLPLFQISWALGF